MIGPGGEFGIQAERWTPLHAGIEGRVESLALAHHVARWAKSITKLVGDAVDTLDLEGREPVPEIQGITDNWWRGADSLIAVYRGEADSFDAPQCLEAHIYRGLDDWGLRGG
ncbi:hypothetical protein [Streptomyces sp. NBC_00564]|uniref:hypothetical protein n=1 Tax=Streptomyces sp. NBC_00564 TaxID=2903663 RepID=UPI00352E553C